MSAPQVKLLVTEAAFEAALHVADGYKVRIAALDALLAEKQRQCDRLSTQLVALTAERNSVCADYISRVSELDKANAEIADYAIEVDRLRNAIRTAADWFVRSTRTDDREQADDLRAALRDGSTE